MIPNRSTSYLGLDAAPNSTLQQAVSICTGHQDQILPQLIAYPNGWSIALTRISPNFPTKALAFCGVIASFNILSPPSCFEILVEFSITKCLASLIDKGHKP